MFARLKDAVTEWNALPAESVGVIALMDSTTEFDVTADPVPPIRVKEGSQLLIVAAEWPVEEVPGSPGAQQRRAGSFNAEEVRPHFCGDLFVEGAAPARFAESRQSRHQRIAARRCDRESMWPQATEAEQRSPEISVRSPSCIRRSSPARAGSTSRAITSGSTLTVERSIVGAITIAGHAPQVALTQSIVDAGSAAAVAAPVQALAIDGCTVFGSVACQTVEASNSLFVGALIASRRQQGCVRFSYLAEGSRTPKRFRCQPDLALAQAADAKGIALTPDETTSIAGRLVPQFTSVSYGHHAYTQLAATCAAEIRTGADDGSEMGVWDFLLQPQREANLVASQDEYLRFGLEAGILYVT